MFAAPSVSVAGSRPGQLPANPCPSSTVSDPPCLGALLAPELVLLLVDLPHAARLTAKAVATRTDDNRRADFLVLGLKEILGVTSMLPLKRCSCSGQAAALPCYPACRAGAGRQTSVSARVLVALTSRPASATRRGSVHSASVRRKGDGGVADLLPTCVRRGTHPKVVNRAVPLRFGRLCCNSQSSCGTEPKVPA